MHLVNALGYLSTRQSQCTFAGHFEKGPVKDHHFYLFESLPQDYRLPLVLQWEGGLLQLFNQEFKNMKRLELVESLVDLVERQYRFRIQHIPGITLNTVLPVSRAFQPSASLPSTPPPHPFLHLIGSDKLYFERDASLCDLNDDAWLQRQAERGNLFHHVVGEEHWTPRPYHQALLSDFKPLVDRNRQLERENARCRKQLAQQKRRNAHFKKKVEHLEKENADWKGKVEQLERENAHWKEKELERENAHWKEEASK